MEQLGNRNFVDPLGVTLWGAELLDRPNKISYMKRMASILTFRKQRLASQAARNVGGYDRLVELEQERRRKLRRARQIQPPVER